MKHPSRWPYIVRLAACAAAYLVIWAAPLMGGFFAITRCFVAPEFSEGERTVFEILWLFGWSLFISHTVMFRVVEPYFQVKTLQNPYRHLFQPQPTSFSSFREWFDWSFRSPKDEPVPTVLPRPTGRSRRR